MATIEDQARRIEREILELGRVRKDKHEERAKLKQEKVNLESQVQAVKKKHEGEMKQELKDIDKQQGEIERELSKVEADVNETDKAIMKLTHQLEDLQRKM